MGFRSRAWGWWSSHCVEWLKQHFLVNKKLFINFCSIQGTAPRRLKRKNKQQLFQCEQTRYFCRGLTIRQWLLMQITANAVSSCPRDRVCACVLIIQDWDPFSYLIESRDLAWSVLHCLQMSGIWNKCTSYGFFSLHNTQVLAGTISLRGELKEATSRAPVRSPCG